ncbi:MAG: hypothetical protein LBS29_05230 [Endomicrobium sp.]|uniref:hypothetical protein n=1 Tax=Candidatus Endomicrobiellum cubanum TaxID=3242325 RepID=UPI002829E0CB|nr:hypothetical protein [Endomicrobium sp.]MDR2395204.1 hypothetical protein [Endomicrobium sp.]
MPKETNFDTITDDELAKVEILHLTKLDYEDYKLNDDECACAGYEGYCATLVSPPRPQPSLPPPSPRPF